MFDVPVNGPENIFTDNKSVVVNTCFPNSALKKKYCAVAHGRVSLAIASGVALVYYEKWETNVADLLNKVLPLVRSIMDLSILQ